MSEITKLTSVVPIDVPTFRADVDHEHALAAAGHPAAVPAFMLRAMDANLRVLGIEVDHEHPEDDWDRWFVAQLSESKP